MNRLLALLAIGSALAVAVAAFAPEASAADTSRVRVVHASPDAPAVDVYVDGSKVLTDVAYKGASDYLPVPAGAHNFKAFATGADPASATAVIDADATLDAGKDYTVLAIGKLADIKPLVLTDDNSTPAAGTAHVRVIHASPDAPAVDVAVKDGPVLFSDLAFRKEAGPAPVDAGTYDLEVRVAGTTTVALPINGVTFESGKIYTVLAVGLVNGTPALEALPLVNDPAPAATAPSPTAQPSGAATSPSAQTLPASGTGSTQGSNIEAMWLAIASVALLSAGAGALVLARSRAK
jgi:hypothetical protein